MKKIIFLGISLVSLLLVIGCQYRLVKPKKLRTDLLRNSDHVRLNGETQELLLNNEILSTNEYEISKIQTKTPLFNWVLDDKSKESISYQLLVSSSIELLNKNEGDLWDSGKINSTAFSQLYAGKELKTEKVYYWKIRYWEEDQYVSAFSKPKSFVIDQNYASGKFSQETLLATDQKPTLIKKKK